MSHPVVHQNRWGSRKKQATRASIQTVPLVWVQRNEPSLFSVEVRGPQAIDFVVALGIDQAILDPAETFKPDAVTGIGRRTYWGTSLWVRARLPANLAEVEFLAYATLGALATGSDDASGVQRVSVVSGSADVRPGAAQHTAVPQNVQAVQIKPANADRLGMKIFNDAASDLKVLEATGNPSPGEVSATVFTIVIPSLTLYEWPQPVYTGQLRGIWTLAGAGAARVTEETA